MSYLFFANAICSTHFIQHMGFNRNGSSHSLKLVNSSI